jgi:predicted nucleotidyltransferase component of viral defense system
MISKDEIQAKAEEFQIHHANVERDYVFGWLLAGIYGGNPLGDLLILKGGNCFRKAYFPMTRFSNDLDFSTQSAVDTALLLAELNKVCDFVHEHAGVVFEKDRNLARPKSEIDERTRVYEARLYFKDFFGNPETITISVRMDITEFDKIYLPLQSRSLIHPYSDSTECCALVKCIKLEEMLATKLKCLLQRRHLADLYDYVYAILINHELEVSRTEIVTTFFRKTIFQRQPNAVSGLLLGLPFQVFKDVWHEYLICPHVSIITFENALELFAQNIKELFGAIVPAFGRSIYFPAELRNPIMEAGANKRLIALTYHGKRREVEPYALVYKQRQDGHAEEYFYGWDRTGGRSSGPGIKTFISSDVESLSVLEQEFDPQYEIVLSKAGEPGKSSYFAKPFNVGRPAGWPAHVPGGRVPSRWHYVIECIYCGKRFDRVKNDVALKEHKDGYGNRCFGRRGNIVDRQFR